MISLRTGALALLTLALAGCGGGNEAELRTWMDDTRKTMRPTTQPVPEPKQFTPFSYEAKALIDPFDPQKMILAAARQAQSRSSTSSIRPDLDRRREMLEGYPLDQLKMVGTLRQAGNQVALIDAAGQTFMVRRGNYIGQNFGLVTSISETEVDLKEIVQDAAGEWIERPTKLELQEAAQRQRATREQAMSICVQNVAVCLSRVAAVLGLIATAAIASAQTAAGDAGNAIERVDAIQTSTGVVVSIEMKNAPQGVPASFSVANPARVALDMPSTVNGLGKNMVELNQGDVRSVNVVQSGGRSRVVVNLKRPLTHTVSIEGKRVLVALGGAADTSTFRAPPGTAAATMAQTSPSAAAPVTAGPSAFTGSRTLRGIDFRRGAENEGRVVVDLSDPNTNVDIRQQGNSVIVDFQNTTLPDTLKRRLDVSDFATPVAQVTASQQGNNARLVVEPRGVWEHNAYQSDTRFVLEVRPVREDPTRLFQGTRQGYQGERLSLNFQNVDVRSLLQVIADFTNLNIITSDSVGGTITLRLKGRSVGPGARHHLAEQGSGHAQERQRGAGCAA